MKDTATGHATVRWTEGESITRAQRGDAAAFECLYQTHSNHVYSVCLRRKRPTEVLTGGLGHTGAGGNDLCELGRADISVLGVIDRFDLARAIHKLPDGYKRFFLVGTLSSQCCMNGMQLRGAALCHQF